MKLRMSAWFSAGLFFILASGSGVVAGSHDDSSMSISFRLAYERETSDTSRMQLESPKEVLYVSNTSILELKDLQTARVEPGPSRPRLIVSVTPDGAKRVKELTSSHLGDRLAVVVNGVLVSAPEIRQVIEGKEMAIDSSRLSSSEMEGLAKKINRSIKSQ